MNHLPNFLTGVRLFLAGALVYFIFGHEGERMFWALAVFLAASLTDYLDGRLARYLRQESVFGKIMDPIADKTLTLSAFGSFWALGLLPGLWVLVVAAREVLVTASRLFSLRRGTVDAARSSGKQKTLFQMVYIIFVLGYLVCRRMDAWDPAWEPAVLAAVRYGMLVILLLTVWSGWLVAKRALSSRRGA